MGARDSARIIGIRKEEIDFGNDKDGSSHDSPGKG
jgi:hypothetical protein